MKANNLKLKDWKDVSKPYHKKNGYSYYERRGLEINKCFGKVQMSKHEDHTSIRAMISTEDPFVKSIPYTKDFKVINAIWEELMNQLLSKIFNNEL